MRKNLNTLENKKVLMIDFDGVILDSMKLHGKLASECMTKHLNMPPDESIKRYYATTGIPFSRQLELIFPEENSNIKKKIELCEKEYNKRKIKEVFSKATLFPDTATSLKIIKKLGFYCVISTSIERILTENLLKKHQINKYFVFVMGKEEGNKREHIRKIMEHKPKIIYFIGDSRSDATLNKFGVITIGMTGSKNKGMLSKAELRKSGADYVVSSLAELQTIIKNPSVNLLKRCESFAGNFKKI